MIDQKITATKDKSVQLQSVPLPKQYPFYKQAALYLQITRDIFNFPQKYKKMNQDLKNKFIDFWIKYLKRNKYMETKQQKKYHNNIINLLENLVTEIQSPNLREQIFKWVRGTQSLGLIQNCLTGSFMPYNKYSNIYQLIITGLKSKKQQTKIQAINVLYRSIKLADFDDVNNLLFHYHGVYTQLLQFLTSSISQIDYQQKPLFLDAINKGALCVNIFLQSYDDNIYRCAQQGAAYLGAILICQNNYILTLSGLMIFQHIANVFDKQTKSQNQCLQFLLKNDQIKIIGVWQKLGRTNLLRKHQKIQIRRQYVSFINNFLSHANKPHIIDFAQLMSPQLQFQQNSQNQYNLIDVLINMFIQNDDPTILQNCMQSLLSIAYYAFKDTINEQNIDFYEQQQNNKIKIQKNKKSLFLNDNIVLYKINNSQMMNKLNQLSKNKFQQDRIGYPQKISQLALQFLQHLDCQSDVSAKSKTFQI